MQPVCISVELYHQHCMIILFAVFALGLQFQCLGFLGQKLGHLVLVGILSESMYDRGKSRDPGSRDVTRWQVHYYVEWKVMQVQVAHCGLLR